MSAYTFEANFPGRKGVPSGPNVPSLRLLSQAM